MKLGRITLAAILSAALAACGGDDDGSGVSRGSGGGGGGTVGDSCSLSERQDWVRGVLTEWYRFPNRLDLTVDKSRYSNLQDYIDALTAPSNALFAPDGGTKTFTYITSIQEENDFIQNGSNAGFGVRLSYANSSNRVFVAEVFETAPAFSAGFDRGTEILEIDGQSVSSLMASGGAQAVVQALGPSDPGVTRSFVIRSVDGVQTSVSVTKAEYSLDPISDRYGVKVLDDGAGGKVGYINLRTFSVRNAEDQLRTAFAGFKNQGIQSVILDLRYNGGGLVSVANLLGDLMGEGLEGQVFSRTTYRESKSEENSTEFFRNQPEQIRTMKMVLIGRYGTASASELVANSMIPYLGDNIALVGADTYGKPVGQDAFDRSACDDRLRAVTFKKVNADDQGEYYGGLASVMPNTCQADDDLADQLGDPGEQSVKVALDFMGGRTCTPISAVSKGDTAQTGRADRQLLQPRVPNAIQYDNPGVY